jgi:hypothetical protein
MMLNRPESKAANVWRQEQMGANPRAGHAGQFVAKLSRHLSTLSLKENAAVQEFLRFQPSRRTTYGSKVGSSERFFPVFLSYATKRSQ